jgi:hypothetical protein
MRRHMLAAALAAGFATPVAGQQSEDLTGSTVALRATEAAGAVAEVVFDNVDNNGTQDNRSFALQLGGLAVDFRFKFQANRAGDDGVWIAPPDGYRADPDFLVCPEKQVCTALIYPQRGVGM